MPPLQEMMLKRYVFCTSVHHTILEESDANFRRNWAHDVGLFWLVRLKPTLTWSSNVSHVQDGTRQSVSVIVLAGGKGTRMGVSLFHISSVEFY